MRVLFALAAGRESLARLRADPRVALVVLAEGDTAVTAHGRPEDKAAALAAGCTEWLTKPLDTRLLARTLTRILTY